VSFQRRFKTLRDRDEFELADVVILEKMSNEMNKINNNEMNNDEMNDDKMNDDEMNDDKKNENQILLRHDVEI
jgi:hypothetical protein